jgi:D-glycero-D-manno-heptose 1,7-bisphosphate phosphatase
MNNPLERRRLLKAPCSSPTPALFLDRDGVLIEDKHHLCDPDQVEFCPGALELLDIASMHGWPVVLITNQSGISRGYFDWEAYERVTDRLLELVGPKAPIAGIYANGHGPEALTTSWRKPSPAMLQAAAIDLRLALSKSLMIGDRLSDLKAGAQAGVAWIGHVLTGHGQQERSAIENWYSEAQAINEGNMHCDVVLLESLLEFPFERLRNIP